MPEPQTYADRALTPDQVKAAGYTDAPLPTSHPWTENYPKTAAAARAVVNALPGAGGVLGTALAGPETGGLAAIPAAALGVGVGRGLRDLIAEGLGLDKPSSPTAKGARIALDTGEAAAAQAILPGLLGAIRTPGKTVREIVDMLPEKLRPILPPNLGKAPAAILQRPAWQTWQDYAAPSEAPTAAAPAASPAVASVPGAPVPPAAEAASTAAPQSTATAPPSARSPQQLLNEAAIAARRAKYQASIQPQAPADDVMQRLSPATAAAVQKPALLASETKEFVRLIKAGKTQREALAAIQVQRDLQSQLGLTTPTAAETRFPKGMRGKAPGDDE